MNELCRDLKLSIWREPDPEEKGREQVRVKLVDELQCWRLRYATE